MSMTFPILLGRDPADEEPPKPLSRALTITVGGATLIGWAAVTAVATAARALTRPTR